MRQVLLALTWWRLTWSPPCWVWAMKNGNQVKESFVTAWASSYPRRRAPGGMRRLFAALLLQWYPVSCSLPGSSVHGILQARMLKWAAMPSLKGSSWPRDWTCDSTSSALAGEFFTTSATWKPSYFIGPDSFILAFYFQTDYFSIISGTSSLSLSFWVLFSLSYKFLL